MVFYDPLSGKLSNNLDSQFLNDMLLEPTMTYYCNLITTPLQVYPNQRKGTCTTIEMIATYSMVQLQPLTFHYKGERSIAIIFKFLDAQTNYITLQYTCTRYDNFTRCFHVIFTTFRLTRL